MPNITAKFEEFNVGNYEAPEGAMTAVQKYWESDCRYNYYLGGCDIKTKSLYVQGETIKSYDSRVQFNAARSAGTYSSIFTQQPIYKDNCKAVKPASFGVYIWKRVT